MLLSIEGRLSQAIQALDAAGVPNAGDLFDIPQLLSIQQRLFNIEGRVSTAIQAMEAAGVPNASELLDVSQLLSIQEMLLCIEGRLSPNSAIHSLNRKYM
jgi:hypothetical protein